MTAISLKARFFASFFFLAVPTVVTWRTCGHGGGVRGGGGVEVGVVEVDEVVVW